MTLPTLDELVDIYQHAAASPLVEARPIHAGVAAVVDTLLGRILRECGDWQPGAFRLLMIRNLRKAREEFVEQAPQLLPFEPAPDEIDDETLEALTCPAPVVITDEASTDPDTDS